MAYFIFLKSVRSLEEFRKILISKFLLNLLVQISKAMVYSKIKFYSEKKFFCHFRPIRPFGPAAAHSFFFFPTGRAPLFPLGLGLTAGPAGPHAGGASPNCHLPHRKTPQAHPSSAAPPPPPAPPRAAQPYLRCRPSFYHPTIISPSLIPPLNLAPTFNGVNAINAAVTPPATPLRCSPRPL
jgi:hypothetical protein